jgi:hypothetical protein
MLAGTDRWNDITNGDWVTMGYFVEIDGDSPPTTGVGAPPIITSNGGDATASVNIAENTTAVTTVVASDVDSPTLTYSIAGGDDAARFKINGQTGALSFVNAPNYEAPADTGANNVYDVVVQASDGRSADTQALSINVTDVNEIPGGPGAPDGFVEYMGHYYKYVAGLFTHTEAEAAAAQAGGYLATITSAQENAVVADLIAGQDLGAWLGGSDLHNEGTWVWTQGPEAGGAFSYSNWAPGEPSGTYNGMKEDYLHMMANDTRWNDAPEFWVTMGYFIELG